MKLNKEHKRELFFLGAILFVILFFYTIIEFVACGDDGCTKVIGGFNRILENISMFMINNLLIIIIVGGVAGYYLWKKIK